MKNVVGAVVAVLLVAGQGFPSVVRPAEASSRARLRWEGAALAFGALGVLAVLNEAAQAQPYRAPARERYGDAGPQYCPPAPDWRPPARPWGPGYWEETRVWVPGGWESVWVWDDDLPGGYDQRRRPAYRDRSDRRDGYRGRFGEDRYRSGRYLQRRTEGRFELRRTWHEGYGR